MSPKDPKSTSNTKNPKNAEPTADAKPPKTEAHVAPAPANETGKQDTKTIVSITLDAKLARQARLLAKVRGVTISSLFVEAAAHTIPVALKAALATIKDEVE